MPQPVPGAEGLTTVLNKRRAELEAAVADAERAPGLLSKLAALRDELASVEARRARALALGDAKAELVYSVPAEERRMVAASSRPSAPGPASGQRPDQHDDGPDANAADTDEREG